MLVPPKNIKCMPANQNPFNLASLRVAALSFLFAVAFLSCSSNADAGQTLDQVTSYIDGQITLSTEVDSVADFSGFEVLIGKVVENTIDTLAHTETDAAGFFAMNVTVPKSDVYSLVIARDGAVLKVDEMVVAQDDSASIKMKFPFGNRPVLVRSHENAALLGYKNTMTLYDQDLKKYALSGTATNEDYDNLVAQTTQMLWNLRETNTGTIAARLASVQSILLLEGWNDSLAVARTKLVDKDSDIFGALIGTARRAELRYGGSESSIELMNALREGMTNEDNLVILQSELVLALRDAGKSEEALEAARMLKMEYATDTTWIEWADKAIYDLEILGPGMPAPGFNAIDVDGVAVNLDVFKGKHVVLEFYAPGSRFEEDLFFRNQAYRASGDTPAFEILSFSLQPDSLLNSAFFDGRDIPGRHVFLPDGGDAAILDVYNVIVLPTRFLIDPESNIVGKYVLGNGLRAFQEAQSRSMTTN